MESTSSASASPRVIGGRYRLERRIASGGTAEVWDAHDQRLTRRVAVKTLHPHLAAESSVRTRFRREAVAAARLHHPSIVRVLDTCSGDDGEALVMEYVAGGTLRDLLRGEALPGDLVAAIGAVVADALDHAHENGLVHRDVKPSNILLSDEGRVLLADLGIAKLDDGAELTRTGHQMLGTARYLAPEQVEGGAVDARTDVYSLGVVLYEAACGRPPFRGESDAVVALRRLREDPLDPSQVHAGVGADLGHVIMRALARDPAARHASAADLRADLLAVAGAARVDVATAINRWRRDQGVFTDSADGDGPTSAVDHPTAGMGDHTIADPTGAGERQARPSFQETERRWLVPAVLIVVAAIALGTAAVLFSTTGVGRDLFPAIRDAVTGGRQVPVAISSANTFDPAGDGHEHDDTAALAIDDDLTTAWTTEGYRQRRFGTKPGVGLFLTVDDQLPLQELVVRSATSGWSAEVHVAPAPAAALDGWGPPVGSLQGAGTEARLDLAGRRGGAVLIWLTDLGDAGPPFRFELLDVELRS